MNQLQAFRDTVAFAKKCGMEDFKTNIKELSFEHLEYMLNEIETHSHRFSQAKLGRWLGWAQCMVVSACDGARLEDMKRINESYKEEV